MEWINIYGLLIVAIFMVPNIMYAIKSKNGFENVSPNKALEIAEQVGRLGCITFMIIDIPYVTFGFWFDGALPFYLVVNLGLTTIYCVIWAAYFRKTSVFKALVLSILPGIIFLFGGVMVLSLPLMVSAVIFAPCHIRISYQNAIGIKK